MVPGFKKKKCTKAITKMDDKEHGTEQKERLIVKKRYEV